MRTIEKFNPLFWRIVTFGWVDTDTDIDFLDVMRTADSNALDDIGQWSRKNGPRPLPTPPALPIFP